MKSGGNWEVSREKEVNREGEVLKSESERGGSFVILSFWTFT